VRQSGGITTSAGTPAGTPGNRRGGDPADPDDSADPADPVVTGHGTSSGGWSAPGGTTSLTHPACHSGGTAENYLIDEISSLP